MISLVIIYTRADSDYWEKGDQMGIWLASRQKLLI